VKVFIVCIHTGSQEVTQTMMAVLYLWLQQILTLYAAEMVVAYHITSHEVRVRTAADSPRLQPHEHHKVAWKIAQLV